MSNSSTPVPVQELDDQEYDGLFAMARARLKGRGSSSASTSMATTTMLASMGKVRAANEPAVPDRQIDWPSNIDARAKKLRYWSSYDYSGACSAATKARDVGKLDALHEELSMAVAEAQAAGDAELVEAIRAASTRQSPKQDKPKAQGDDSTSKGKPSHIDAESKELLHYISEDFVLLTVGSRSMAYHKESGDQIGKEAFAQYGAKHYGDVIFVDENGTEVDRVSSGQIWWAWNDPERRVVKTIIMEPTSKPEHEGDPTAYNRWHMLKKTMVEPNYSATQEDILPLLEHLMFISDGDEVVVLYFLNWLATLFQFPETKIPVAILMYSKFGGVGKNLIQRLLTKVFGRPLVTNCTGRALQKAFDDAIEHRRIVFINELARSEKQDGYENFKSQVSEEYTQFEGKGRASKEVRNVSHFVITTNNLDAIPMMQGDRRIAVFLCNAAPHPATYYEKLVAWIDGPGAPALANVLRTWEFPEGWNAHAPAPQTCAAKTMQKASRDELEVLLAELIEAGTAPCDKDIVIVDDLSAQLNTLFSSSLTKRASRTSVGKALQANGAEFCEKRIEGPDGKTPNRKFYLIRNNEQWSKATPKQRGDHLKTGARLFSVPVETKVSEVNGDEQ